MEQRNVFLAIVLSLIILLGWQYVVVGPQAEKDRAAREAAEAQKKAAGQVATPTPQPGASPPALGGVPRPPGVSVPGTSAVPTARSRQDIVSGGERVNLDSKLLTGSISLKGARLDDLTLTQYREEVQKDSPNIVMLSPQGAEKPYFAQFGWVPSDTDVKVPGPDAVWTADRRNLAPGRTVTLKWDNGQGLEFEQAVTMDENYMFTVTQRVKNSGEKAVALSPYGLMSRTGTPETLGFYILHEGLLGVFDGALTEIDYDDLQEEKGGSIANKSIGGWIGITDKYWLAALIPDQKTALNYRFNHTAVGKTDKYQVDFLSPAVTVPAGGVSESTSRVFAGAKVVRMLDAYEKDLGVPVFDKAVDFGWFYWLTKPIFYALDYLFRMFGNFGIAILLLTVGIKLLFFPLANKSYKAMSRMKTLQPKMLEIRERFPEDRAKQNQAMMELYRKENANPMAGCLPIVIQIPVFFALYKVLFVTIEMRHAPFFGWIHDLSAPDPLGLLIGFGLVPWDVPEILMVANVGIWPIIMGLTMFLQQKLNPQPADPMQAKVFMFLPLIFTFLLGSFPAGLVIYWAWNNLLSICQQWVIMRRMGVTASGHQVATKSSPAISPPPRGQSGKSAGKSAGKPANEPANEPANDPTDEPANDAGDRDDEPMVAAGAANDGGKRKNKNKNRNRNKKKKKS